MLDRSKFNLDPLTLSGSDMENLGVIHDNCRRVSEQLYQVKFCNTDPRAITIRKRIRANLKKARVDMRILRDYMLEKKKNGTFIFKEGSKP